LQSNSHLHILQWVRSQEPPCPWNKLTCVAAASGHLDVLKWLRSQDPPCPWNTSDCLDEATDPHIINWINTFEAENSLINLDLLEDY